MEIVATPLGMTLLCFTSILAGFFLGRAFEMNLKLKDLHSRLDYNTALKEFRESEYPPLKLVRESMLNFYKDPCVVKDAYSNSAFHLVDHEIRKVNKVLIPLGLFYRRLPTNLENVDGEEAKWDAVCFLNGNSRALIVRLAQGDVPYD